MVFFVDKLWPDFSFKDFLSILIRYQINYKSHYQKLKQLEEKNEFPIISM